MANKKISISFGSDIKLDLDANLPNIDEIIDIVIKNKDKIDIDSIKVEADDSNFDTKGFESIISDSIKNFLEDIKIDEENFTKAMELTSNEENQSAK